MKKLILSLVLLLGILLGACAPQPVQAVEPSQAPANEKFYCIRPESDNGNSWATGAQVCYDTQVYTLSVKLLGESVSNQTQHSTLYGSSYGGYGSVSGKSWTEGKGVFAGEILTMSPEADWVNKSLPYVFKTTDLGIMGIPDGATIELLCNHDVEVLSPVFPYQTLTTDRLTDELDDCRLKSKNFVP